MACKELPTKEGAVVVWGYYYDGRNYCAATLSWSIRYSDTEIPDPEYPEGYGEGEEIEMIHEVEYEGLMWHLTGEATPMTPAEFGKRFAVDHAWWDLHKPGVFTAEDVYAIDVLREGFDPK